MVAGIKAGGERSKRRSLSKRRERAMQARRVNLCRWDVKAVCEQRQGGEEATVQTITPPSPATEAGIRNPVI